MRFGLFDYWIKKATFSQREYTSKGRNNPTESVIVIEKANDKEQIRIDKDRNKDSFKRIQGIIGEKMILTSACGYGSEKTLIKEKEFLPGEIAACIIRLDGYEIRSAARIYTDKKPTYFSRKDNEPASPELIEYAKNDMYSGQLWCGYRLVHEISARYIASDNDVFIPLAAACQGFAWSESLGFIGTGRVKSGNHKDEPVLFVHKRWIGSSFGSNTWYAMLPEETIKEYKIHDMDTSPKRTHWNIWE